MRKKRLQRMIGERLEELVDGGQVVDRLFGDEGVDLDGEAELGGVVDGVDGPVEAAFDSANGLVAGGVGAIEA